MVKINIILKFLGTGYNEFFQANVKIYDDNKLIYDGYSFNGIIKLCLQKNKVYRLDAVLFNNRFVTSFYVSNQNLFVFNLNNNRTITFLLTDYNYNNLPIMEGEIFLG